MPIKETWKTASPLVKTLTAVFVFVTAGASALGVIWQCNSSVNSTSQNIKSIPQIQKEITDINKRYSEDSTDKLLRQKDYVNKRAKDSSAFMDSLADHRADIDYLLKNGKFERVLFRSGE